MQIINCMEGLDLGGKEHVCNLTMVHGVHTHTAEGGEIGERGRAV